MEPRTLANSLEIKKEKEKRREISKNESTKLPKCQAFGAVIGVVATLIGIAVIASCKTDRETERNRDKQR